jgi:hypothetical protein
LAAAVDWKERYAALLQREDEVGNNWGVKIA